MTPHRRAAPSCPEPQEFDQAKWPHTHNPLHLQHHACNTLIIRHLCTMSPASNCISLWCTTNITTNHRQCYWEIVNPIYTVHRSMAPRIPYWFFLQQLFWFLILTVNSILMTQQLPTPLITHKKFVQIQQNNQFQARRGQPACSGWKWLQTSSFTSHRLGIRMKRVCSGTVEEEKQTHRVLSIRLARVLVLATSLLVSFTVHLLLLHGSSQQNNFNTSGSASAQSDEKDSHQKILLYITTHMFHYTSGTSRHAGYKPSLILLYYVILMSWYTWLSLVDRREPLWH